MNITRAIRTAAGFLVRFAVLWFVDALSLLLTSWILPGVNLAPVMMAGGRVVGPLTVATAAAFLLTIVNFLIRPAVFAVARPLGWIALFVVGFVVNAAALWLTAWLLPGFDVDLARRPSSAASFSPSSTRSSPASSTWTRRAPGTRTASSSGPRDRTLRRRRRTRPRADDAGDRRPELLASSRRRWTPACCPRCAR